jgi:hypothetical protein
MRWPRYLAMQLREILSKAVVGETCGDTRTEKGEGGSLIFQCVAENVARLFLHAVPVPGRAALQPGFDLIF